MADPQVLSYEENKGPSVDKDRLTSLSVDHVKASKSYVPEGFKTQEEFLRDMREEYEYDLAADEKNRKESRIDKSFVSGEGQWDEQARRQREGLPCLIFNSIPQFTAQVVGDWRENKRGIKVLPTSENTRDIADIRGDLIRSIEKQSSADAVYDETFESTIQCGDGAFRVAVEYAKNDVFDQDIFIRPIADCLSVVWDRSSTDPTGKDARHCFVDDIITKKEFKQRWPDKDPSELSKSEAKNLSSNGWLSQDGVRITEYWRLVEREELLALFEDGSVRFVSEEDDIEALMSQHGQILKTRFSPVTYAQMHLCSGYSILSGPYEYQLNRLPIIRMAGRTVNLDGESYRYGLVRFMRDPVRLRNYWRSVAAEQLGYAPKVQWIATESAVAGYEDALRKAHMSRDPLLIVSDDAEIGRNLQRMEPPVPQNALFQEAQMNTQDMKDVTGIHDASLGIKSNETSGRAIAARQQQGGMASMAYYDNGNLAVLEAGDVINQLIGQIYDGTRIIRIVSEDEKVKFLKINDPADPRSPDLSVGKYDVTLSTGASFATRRLEAAQAMMDAVQVWPQLLEIAGDIVAKAQDWPGADKLAERIKKTIPQQFLDEDERDGPDPQLVEAQQQIEQLAHQLQLLSEEKEIDKYNAITQRLRALSDNMVDDNKVALDAMKVILDQNPKKPDEPKKKATQPSSSQ
ncbi:MAG: portal protein [Vulcanimicrobiota bacterium]